MPIELMTTVCAACRAESPRFQAHGYPRRSIGGDLSMHPQEALLCLLEVQQPRWDGAC